MMYSSIGGGMLNLCNVTFDTGLSASAARHANNQIGPMLGKIEFVLVLRKHGLIRAVK